MPLDKEKYRPALKSLGLPREKEDSILECIFNIMAEFVSAAFGRHPVQHAMKERDRAGKLGRESRPMLPSPDIAIAKDFGAACEVAGYKKGKIS